MITRVGDRDRGRLRLGGSMMTGGGVLDRDLLPEGGGGTKTVRGLLLRDRDRDRSR